LHFLDDSGWVIKGSWRQKFKAIAGYVSS